MSSLDPFPSWYNSLPTVEQASEIFNDEARKTWLPCIAAAMVKHEEYKPYALTLVHHHIELEDSERMIATGPITRPEDVKRTQAPNVIPSSWDSQGNKFEWQRVVAKSDLVPPPSESLLENFRNIFKEDKSGVVKVLGLVLKPEAVALEEVWWESTDKTLREHMVERKRRSDAAGTKTFETCWILQLDPATMEVVMMCCGVCKWH